MRCENRLTRDHYLNTVDFIDAVRLTLDELRLQSK